MAQEYWIYKGSSCHFDDLELNDEADGMVKSKPCGFYDGVSLSDTIEGGIHVIEYSEYERLIAENARYREALEYIQLENKKGYIDFNDQYKYWRDQEFKSRIKAREALKGVE